jgi:hypothetical protein
MEYQPEPSSSLEMPQSAELSNLEMQQLTQLHNSAMQQSGLLTNSRPSEIQTASGEGEPLHIVNENVETEQRHDSLKITARQAG